jgi:FAD:protein FMN transferase
MAASPTRKTPRLGAASWEALGTTVTLRTSEPSMAASARAAVARELDAIDLACSRFRPDSELSRLNRAAGRRVRVGPLLAEALELALRAARLTAGDVDPTLGHALELAGYDRDWRELDSLPGGREGDHRAHPHAKLTLRVRSGWQAVSLDRAGAAASLPAGVRLDLGATAKAWAADRAARAAAKACGCGVLVGVGGDVSSSGPAPRGGWRVHVTDDHRSAPGGEGQTISIRSGGLATSSTAVRRWRHAGRTMHHIIDPATGAPADTPWRTVSVAAGNCADANIASTAALLRGERAPRWLAAIGLPARLVDNGGRVSTVGAWPAEVGA